ncbi:DUF6663 family protein [Halococcus salsus]|uniref:DUF6663 family protein n=1 Tax=Halococcus salsus TaxID=2162894 RepID=UPI00135B2DF9|nr:DUF6663 family protein [Halococcus salsus]
MQTTAGTYRVLRSPRDPDELLLLDVESQDPTYVPSTGYEGDLAERVAELEAGNRIAAEIVWADGPRFAAVETETETTVEFVDGATGIFEAARETWNEAEREGRAMNSRVTRDTDGEPNGVVYTFAKQSGERDLFTEFRDGVTPLEPLIDRLAEGAEPPFAGFVIRPADEPFVLVALAIDRTGPLAETIRETYAGAARTTHGL